MPTMKYHYSGRCFTHCMMGEWRPPFRARDLLVPWLIHFRRISTLVVRPIVARHWTGGEFGWDGISVKY